MIVQPVDGRSFIATFALVLVAIAGLFTVDLFLAKTDRAESQIEAARLFEEGQTLLKNGASLKAVDKISDAIAIERENRDYLRTLAKAQLAAGDSADAQTTLTGLLSSNSTDGFANLLMARVLLKQGRVPEAVSYFHRAIYGYWKDDAPGNRRRARLELIDLLAQQNSKEELLAELLPIQDNAPQDSNTRVRLGELFLRAGSATRAAEVFRGVLRDAPSTMAAYRGLGEAEFAQGDYRAAEKDFQATLRLAPDDPTGRHWLDLCHELLQLDPTIRGLDSNERWRRSQTLVQLVDQDVSSCLREDSPPDLKEWEAKAAAVLKVPPKRHEPGETFETNVDLAEQLWQIRQKECQPKASEDSALALVLQRVAR